MIQKIFQKIFYIHPLTIGVWSLASRCRVSMNRILGNHFTKFGYPQLETPYPNQPYGTYFWYVIGEVSWLSQSIVGSERPNCYARNGKLETVPFILSLKDPLWRIGSTPVFVWSAFKAIAKGRLNDGYRTSGYRISLKGSHNWLRRS